MQNVSGKTVLITGAARGLGKLFAERAVAEGAATVVVWDIDSDALAATTTELSGRGTTIHADVVDLADENAISAAAERVRATTDGIDILINNAGIVRGNDYFWESNDRAGLRMTMAVNSLAPMFVTREFLPAMVAGKRESRVVTIASVAGFLTSPRMSVYHASKWAAVGWSDSVRLEIAQAGHAHVKVTTVCPAFIDTGMFAGVTTAPFTPLLRPADVVATTWTAMCRGEAMVLTPWTARLGRMASNVLPPAIRDYVLDRLGVHQTMVGFRGH